MDRMLNFVKIATFRVCNGANTPAILSESLKNGYHTKSGERVKIVFGIRLIPVAETSCSMGHARHDELRADHQLQPAMPAMSKWIEIV
jgi:hypothetical protein